MLNQIQQPQIIEENDHYWILYKPAGWFVHPPSDKRALKQFSNFILTTWFWKNHKIKAYPVHRLDFATEGIMIWAKNPQSAGSLNLLHQDNQLEKTYHAVVRGFTQDEGIIDLPLQSDSSPDAVECVTYYRTLKRVELPVQINSAHGSTRYSWVEVKLGTGRWHQIRRHFNRISHPLIGDREHGDSHHNRFFRDELKISGLLLIAQNLRFQCPYFGQSRNFAMPVQGKWIQVQKLFANGNFN